MSSVVLALDGRVSMEVVDATTAELRAVVHQTGLAPVSSQAGGPALSLRFVDRLPLAEPLRLVGGALACTPDGVVTGVGGSRSGPRSLVPMLSLGGRTEMLCEHGAGTVPFLMDVLNVTALAAGLLPLHAGAFSIDGVGTVVTGWSKGGKTETVLGVLTARPEACFVGDEWVYVDPVARDVLGSAHPIRVWDWQLQQLPQLCDRISRKELRRMAVIRRVEHLHATGSPRIRRTPPGKVVAAALPLLRLRNGAYVEPADLFGADRLQVRMPFDRLVQVESWDSPETRSTPADPARIAARMAWSLQHERRELTEAYEAFRYVHPEASNPWLEAVGDLEQRLLSAAFAGLPAAEVRHPYPVDIAGLAACVLDAVS